VPPPGVARKGKELPERGRDLNCTIGPEMVCNATLTWLCRRHLYLHFYIVYNYGDPNSQNFIRRNFFIQQVEIRHSVGKLHARMGYHERRRVVLGNQHQENYSTVAAERSDEHILLVMLAFLIVMVGLLANLLAN